MPAKKSPVTPIAKLASGRALSVRGEVTWMSSLFAFDRQTGDEREVREAILEDKTGSILTLFYKPHAARVRNGDELVLENIECRFQGVMVRERTATLVDQSMSRNSTLNPIDSSLWRVTRAMRSRNGKSVTRTTRTGRPS